MSYASEGRPETVTAHLEEQLWREGVLDRWSDAASRITGAAEKSDQKSSLNLSLSHQDCRPPQLHPFLM